MRFRGFAEVGGTDVQGPHRCRSETPEAQVDTDGEHRHVGAAEQVGHVVAEAGQVEIAML